MVCEYHVFARTFLFGSKLENLNLNFLLCYFFFIIFHLDLSLLDFALKVYQRVLLLISFGFLNCNTGFFLVVAFLKGPLHFFVLGFKFFVDFCSLSLNVAQLLVLML